jgi:lipid A disaccharide synthetase
MYVLHLLIDIYLLYYYILHFKEIFSFFCVKLLVTIWTITLSNLLIALKIVSHPFSSISEHLEKFSQS